MSIFNSIINTFRAEDFRRKIELLTSDPAPASTQGKKECCRSGQCCWRAPGELSRADVERLARLFGMTDQEFFREYCVVDWNRGHILRLRRAHQKGGHMLPAEETWSTESPCVFLSGGPKFCSVHSDKPEVCARYKCWEGPTGEDLPSWTKEELMALGWDGIDPDW